MRISVMAAIKLAIIEVKVFITWERAFASRMTAEADVLLVAALKNIAWRSCALAGALRWMAGARGSVSLWTHLP